ncbi:hypothetical protein [Nonomuraea pusilla]|uniref:Uncharacterized protein n=1 Tax=Nonomuraea pusilla TaxID=46177 RepID=A0A1H8K6Y5_9ACTN|nr:hypothetical protein [Nonomuraea pusilla]SEN88694.1 hypothetical protein SAMN05660976_08539 [Nonomuraea pusilla]
MTPREAAFRVAVLNALAKRVSKALADARAEAEPMFASVREMGVTQLEVALPSGETVGKVSIKAGEEAATVDEDALLKWVEANCPEEIEHSVSTAALSKPDVVAYVRKLHPELVTPRIRPAYRTKLLAGLSDDGELVSETTGEVVKVREVVKRPANGAFMLTFDKASKGKLNGRDRIAAAWQSGELSIAEMIRPAIEAGEQG